MKRSVIAALTVLIPALVQAQAKQAPTPSPSPEAPAATFPAGIEQVIVDTVVTDKKGNPIGDLKQGEFRILEDGAPQDIVSFEAVQIPDRPAAPAVTVRPSVTVNQRPEDRTGRTFVIVFDDIQMTNFQARSAKAAVAEFLKSGVREGDRVSLVATSGAAWWSARMEAGRDELIALLKRIEGRQIPDNSPERMSDYEAMRIQAYNDTEVMGRVTRRFENLGVAVNTGTQAQRSGDNTLGDPMVRSRASEVYFKAVTRNRLTLQVLQRVLESLTGTKGRKSVILVSQGFIWDPNLDEFKQVVQASRRGNAAVYFVDTRGLGDLQSLYSAEFQSQGTDPRDLGSALLDNVAASEGSEGIASDTGGFTVKNTNDLAAGIQKIANETRTYYLLGYNPTNTKQDGRFRKIQVKVARKSIEVRARRGYYAPLEGKAAPPRKPGENDPVIQAALDSPFDMDEIPIRMTAYAFDETLLGKVNAIVATDVDVKEFAFQEQDGRLSDSLEFLLVVAHRESGEFYQYNQKVDMKLLPPTRDKLKKTWYPILRDFELAAGGYQAKIVVRDKNSGRVGTVIHEFDVPDPALFRPSSLSLSDTLEPNLEGEQGSPRPVLLARREFASGAMVYGQFSVYGAEKDKTTGMPKVSAGYEIKNADGSVKTRVTPTVINPTSLGKLSRLMGTSLQGFEPGAYTFDLTLKDELSGKTAEIQELFTVSSAETTETASAGSR
jgi:VWFA-related protein